MDMSSRLAFTDTTLGLTSSYANMLHIIHEHAVLVMGLATGLVLASVVRYLKSPWRRLPPGPAGLPLIGNAMQITTEQWIKYSAWRKEYGDIIYLSALGRPIVVLNESRIAVELLDRRAAIYSDRPSMIVASEILSDGLLLPVTRYGEVWRRMRKATHEALNKVVAHGLNDYQTEEAVVLARNTLLNAAGWDKYIRGASASTMLRGLYDDSPVSGEHDARVSEINDFAVAASTAALPGAYWVDMMPWMRHIPSLFAPWKRNAQASYRAYNEAFHRNFERVQKDVAEGNARASLCATLIDDKDRYQLSTHESAWVAASVYAAGSDTTRAALSWWTLAMLLYPDTQKRAQEELDAVVGRARLPIFADMDRLPYISAMVKEVGRWRPVLPIGLPHQSIEDDFYEGHFIPKGTVVLANVWEMNHDPEIFGADAHQFNPDRYLNEEGLALPSIPGTKDDGHYTFGFGRRICVGRHVANNNLYIDIATCLWAFSFANPQDQNLDADTFVDEGVVVVPKPFDVQIEARFSEALSVLDQECELRGR